MKRAKETARKVKADMEALSRELEQEISSLNTAYNAQAEELNEIVIRAKATDINVPLTALAWMPYAAGEEGRLRPAW